MKARLTVLLIGALLLIPTTSGPQLLPGGPALRPGQTATTLPDGRWLLLGGTRAGRPTSEAAIWDPRVQALTPLAVGLATPRAWHTATVIPDGTVLIIGGLGPHGVPTGSAEQFNPVTGGLGTVASGFSPRAFHTATLLTDGRMLIAGGMGGDGALLSSTIVWSPLSTTVTAGSALTAARIQHEATLLPDGRVLLWGGVDVGGAWTAGELFDPVQDSTTAVLDRPAGADSIPVPPRLVAALPADGSGDVPNDVVIALRFSKPLQAATVNATTIMLSGPKGLEPALVVPAEGGRLVFVTPERALASGASYTLSLNGPSDAEGFLLAAGAVSFTTAPTSGSAPASSSGLTVGDRNHDHATHHGDSKKALKDAPVELDEWEWKGARRKGKPHSPWQDLPPLKARPGVTALAGQVLRLNGQPLTNVTLRIEQLTARTDHTGRFLLAEIPAGNPLLEMDGSTASRPGRTFGMFEVKVEIKGGRTNVLPYTIWLPLIDTANAAHLPVPTPQEVVVTSPRIPGLELRIPAGVYLKSRHTGQPLTEVALTQIPVDRPPFPVPEGSKFFFTPQTHGAEVLRPDGTRSPVGVRFILPNFAKWAPGVRKDLWTFSPARHWYVYGQGTVNRAGDQIIPDPGVEFFRVPCAHPTGVDSDAAAVNPPVNGKKGADPVDLATGLFVMEKVDLVIPDVIPIIIRRSYRPNDAATQVRSFGMGQSFDYQPFLVGEPDFSRVDLITAVGERIRYLRTSPGTDFAGAVLEHTASPTAYQKSVLKANSARPGWDLTFRDGTVWELLNGSPGAQLVAIQDRHGNRLTITRGLESQNRRIQRITSPSGRWVELTWTNDLDPNYRVVTQVKDHTGRTVDYAYELIGLGNRRLTSVTDPNGGVTQYTYDANHRMVTVKDAKNIVYLTNEYDAAGRVFRQTQADTTTYQFAYTLDENGKIIQTDMTDPRGHVDRTTFDTRGYPLSETRGQGTAIAQTTTYQREAATSRVTSMTDALGRTTAYTYDSHGNVLTVTRLSGTPNAVTTTFTYEPTYQQVSSVTDPLNHTTTFDYDATGNVTTITDPLLQPTTMTHNAAGQPLTVTTPAGTTTLVYEMGDLAQITDPAGNTTTRFTDAAGRLLAVTTPLGQRTHYEYDVLNRLTKITDPLGGITQFGYDPNGNLLTVTDARTNTTSYVYNNMDRLQTRTDPLLRPESYVYDNNGNLATFTDRKSQATGRVYDALDRVTQVTYADQSTTSYTWDAGNRLTQITDSISGTISRSYDLLDRLTQETTPQGSVSYTYDAAGRRTSMTVAGQPTVSYGYDNADRLTSITQGSTVVSFSYDTAGRRTALTLPGNVITEYAYDTASRLTGLTYKHGTTTLGTLTYTSDANSQRRRIGGTWARTGVPQAVTSATYTAANHQLTFGSQTLTYDLNGNLTSDGTNSYTWNSRNELTTITGPTGATFVYDALGRRRQKTIAGTTTSFLYDGLNAIQEATGSDVTNVLTALGVDESLMRTDAGASQGLLSDGLGSTLALAATGEVVTEYTYEPFGATGTTGAGSTNPSQYTGRENDTTGLYYYRARYYSPVLTRFISEDPLASLIPGFDTYTYVGNNPLGYKDPLGLERVPTGPIVQVGCFTADERFDCSVREGGGLGGGSAGIRTPILHGTGRAPHVGRPNSIYEQRTPAGLVRSRTFYDENGRSFTRQDFERPHRGLLPHEQLRGFDQSGHPKTKETYRALPPGYTDRPTPE